MRTRYICVVLYPVNITANVKINRKPVDLDAMITTPKICVEVIAKRLIFSTY